MLAILLCATTAIAAPPDDFYDAAFRQGVAAFEAGTYDLALSRLRIAAFGYVEDLPRYETTEAYIAVASQRIGQNDKAKAALLHIVSAERVAHNFAALQLSPALRASVNEAAKALLTPQQAAQLTMPPAEQQIAAPTPTPPPSTAQPAPAGDSAMALAEAERALNAGDTARAKQQYESILAAPSLPHLTLLRIGEGLYRARDFAGAARAFARAGTFAKGEEPFRYYYAVALFESGRYADAKRELAAALPYIEPTPEVKQYRAKIESSLD
ncbi:MAG TPA: tetratricopeptide repeat protein [Thermoanaerobaculia bacterium]|nr:tetratricopeptide repeat protein [Thermoanaerobaculia bacterium]